ncbi:anti-sigma regulatory factor (Ser/Thr protein kinase) [Streptomyces sp. SAI-170]|uniref:ATP-binding protein n=1 Tax=Streptomyces sp. SAI-170 TaxID=3377729 RepID=UPI003C7D592D
MDLTSTARTAPRQLLYLASSVHSVRVTAPARAECVGLLRKRASALFAAWAMSDDAQAAAELVISELLTNAVLHGRGMMTLAITRTGPTLDISVDDHGQSERITPPCEPGEHGRGLAIVAAVSCGLQIDETPRGWRARARMNLEP